MSVAQSSCYISLIWNYRMPLQLAGWGLASFRWCEQGWTGRWGLSWGKKYICICHMLNCSFVSGLVATCMPGQGTLHVTYTFFWARGGARTHPLPPGSITGWWVGYSNQQHIHCTAHVQMNLQFALHWAVDQKQKITCTPKPASTLTATLPVWEKVVVQARGPCMSAHLHISSSYSFSDLQW